MPIDPYAALNAMVRAEVARSHEPVMDNPAERHPEASSEESSAGDAPASGNRD